MPLPHDDLETMEHTYTSCTEAGMENRGYCTRCSELAFQSRDRYREALENIIANEESYNRGDALSAYIAKTALGVVTP